MSTLNLKPKIRILNAEFSRFSCNAINKIDSLGDVTHVDANRDYLIKNIKYYDIIIICINNFIDREILKLAQNLKIIVTPTTGINHIDLIAANEFNIKIISLKGETEFLKSISATAEHTWGMLLCLQRKINLAHNHVLKGFWNREEFSGNELRGKVLGIIGFGRLGEMVADYANAFGMKVIAYDKRKIHNNAQFVTLDELLHKSDIISVHLSLSKTTKNFLDLEKVLELKKNPLLINTSRGEIIDENALVYALENNLISGAALDVLPGEVSTDIAWLKNSLLWQYANNNDNLLLTPHIGGVTMESVENTNLFIINKLKDYIKKVFS